MIRTHSQTMQGNVGSARPIQNTITFSDASSTNSLGTQSASTSSCLFPSKLHAMLEDATKNGFSDIVCWLHGGATFKVQDPSRFTEEVMPKYFNQRKYKSFLRQLNLYGFQRIHHGPHKGGYAHKYFLQGAPALCEKIIKSAPRSKEQIMARSHRRVVSTDTFNTNAFADLHVKAATANDYGTSTPDHFQQTLDQFPPMYVSGEDCTTVSELDDTSSSGSSARFPSSSSLKDNGSLNPLPVTTPVNRAVTQEAIQHILPETTNLVQTTPVNEIFREKPFDFHVMDTQVEKALLSTFVTDGKEMERDLGVGSPMKLEASICDELLAIVNDKPITPRMEPPQQHSLAPLAPAMTVPSVSLPPAAAMSPFAMSGAPISPLALGAVSEFNFPRKVYRMLEDAENHPVYGDIVSWAEDGMAFKVHDKKLFVEKILPIYFDMTQYASFRRQLNMYSFDRKHTSTYSNPFFAKGCPDLLEKIVRKSGGSKAKKRSKN